MKKENPSPDFIQIEHQILKFWEDEQCFKKLVEKNKNGKRFRFLDGPITANNPMGIHHAWGRTLKDVYIRAAAQEGKSCQYQNGFDAQGLWVEVEVEKELGIKTKRDIVEYGLDKFTDKCIERVKKFSGVITEQSKRLGQWMDWDNSYYTNSDENITSIWYFLKKCHEKGWLKKAHRPMPWCPRCGTSLSEHEMSGSYKEVEHLSIFAKLPIDNTKDSIIVWTTTPWTLSSNVALAVNPEIEYVRVKVKSDSRTLILGKNAIKQLKGDILEVLDTFKGSELIGKTYSTCYPDFLCQNFPHKIVPWADVDAEEGTGVVHIAPGCGAEDFELGKTLGLETICPIDEEGKFVDGFGSLSGKRTTDVVDEVVEHLRKNGKLYKTELYTHSYPYCWRCKTDVVFKLVDEWYIDTEEIRPLMIAAAAKVNFEPDYAGKRMYDWLSNMGDWNISRKRFYGLPLPFYVCKKCGHLTVIGSKEELEKMSVTKDLSSIPHLHRPWVDDIKIICPVCGEEVSRIPEVGDCWLDAGITPFSTKKYFTDKNYFNDNFPSELVLEMKEQIRLWFYSQLFMSVTLENRAPYENVVTHSSVIKEDGGKFHKTGYMIRFDEAAEQIGADPVRYLFASAPVSGDVRFGYNLTDEARRKILSFWNIYVFFNLYASLDNPDLVNFTPDEATLTHSDKWLLERTNRFIEVGLNAYKSYRVNNLMKEFEIYTDEVSNWYIRINRKRFWKSTEKVDQMNAYWCLYNALKASVRLLSPVIPFITDYIWQNMVREIEPNAEISVHHAGFPDKIWAKSYPEKIAETDVARAVITTAQRMRNEASIKIKQPLSALYLIASNEEKPMIETLSSVIKDELNIKNIIFTEDENDFNDAYLTVNFKVAGAALKGEAQKLKQAVEALNAEGMKKAVAEYEKGSLNFVGFDNLSSALFDKHLKPKANFVVTKERDLTLAIDTSIDNDLLEEGTIRELIRQIQVLRKDAGFAVEDRITIALISDSDFINNAIDKYIDKIKDDVLAKSYETALLNANEKEISLNGESVKIFIK